MVLLSFHAYQKSALLCCSQASSEIATWGVRVMLTALLHHPQTMMEEKLRWRLCAGVSGAVRGSSCMPAHQHLL